MVGITERAVQRIVLDLSEAGYIERERSGRRNRYSIREKLPLRHSMERHCEVGELISLVLKPS
jgi:DNA-binding transcriptional regulator PaaX